MSVLFTITYCIWFLSEILINRLFHSKVTDRQQADKNSLSLIWVTVIVSIAAAVYISMRYAVPLSYNPLVQYGGLSLLIAGIVLRIAVISSMGIFLL